MTHTGCCRKATHSLISAYNGSARRTKCSPPRQIPPSAAFPPHLAKSSAVPTTATTARALGTWCTGHARFDLPGSTASAGSPRCGARQGPKLQRSYRSRWSSTSATEEAARRRAPVQCGVVSPARAVPDHIPKTPYYATGAVPPADNVVSDPF